MNTMGTCTERYVGTAASSSSLQQQDATAPGTQEFVKILQHKLCESPEVMDSYASKPSGIVENAQSPDSCPTISSNCLLGRGDTIGTSGDCVGSATTASGITVDAKAGQIILPSGKIIKMPDGLGDTRITELEDGGIMVVTASSTSRYDKDGKPVLFDKDGNPLSSKAGEDPFTGTDGNDIIINFTGKKIDAGAGNDTILNYASNTSIVAGAGNDRVILASTFADTIEVDLGDGDDQLNTKGLHMNSLIVMGNNGNDEIQLGRMRSKTLVVNGGDGNDRISAGEVVMMCLPPLIDGGGGDDQISVDSMVGTISGGEGKNTININNAFWSVIDASQGENIINIDELNGSRVAIGEEGNTVNIREMFFSKLFTTKGTASEDEENAENTQASLTDRAAQALKESKRRFDSILSQSTEIKRTSVLYS